jgi:tRNA (guanine37-N1)-methyltransferase
MKIKFLTLFPKLYSGLIGDSIIKKAIDADKVQIEIIDIRKYADNKHNKVDDYPYGGGPGMVMMIEPIVKAIKDNKTKDTKIYLMTPHGKVFNQDRAKELSKEKEIMLISGHYEGIDYRVLDYIDGEISIGDYILTGGELPSMVIADAIIRLQKGVIKEESISDESFEDNLLEYPQYTRPEEYDGKKVPSVLLSGHHKDIED